MSEGLAGRHCPLSYRYTPAAVVAQCHALAVDVCYVVGGLYGNPEALDAVEAMARRERAAGRRVEIIFNGDFHWFDAEPAAFREITARVLRHHALAGNVEAELAEPQPGAGCGCAYPDDVDETVVARSNAIMARLQAVAADCPDERAALGRLPYHRCVELAGHRLVVLHGDPQSLAGWGLGREALLARQHRERLRHWFQTLGAQIIAATHTCLPALWQEGERVVINNGSAGMGNYRHDPRGLITRVAVGSHHDEALFSCRSGPLIAELVPLAFDQAAWQARFARWWPPGSAAECAYGPRIRQGTSLLPAATRIP